MRAAARHQSYIEAREASIEGEVLVRSLVDALTAGEAKSGTCNPDHEAALAKLLDRVEARLRAKTEDGRPLMIESFTNAPSPSRRLRMASS